MILHRTGEIVPGLYALGSADIPMFLLDGPEPILFDAGFDFLGAVYAEEIRSVLGNRQPALLCLSHSHFDHCGSAAYIKNEFPELRIAASAPAVDILQRPGALERIAALNRAAEQMVDSLGITDMPECPRFAAFPVDLPLTDNQLLPVAGAEVRVLATPGHTRDSVSYYIPGSKALLPSEALGIGYPDGTIISEWLVDYDAYVASMDRLSQLPVRVLGLGHRSVYTDSDAARFMADSKAHCRRFRARIEACLANHQGEVALAVAELKTIEYDRLQGPKQPEPAYLLNLEARVRSIKAHLQQAG